MSILGTGRANLAQADYANKASTGLANARAQSNAGITIADQNAKKSMRGQALGAAGTLGLAAYGATPTVGAGTAAASGLAPAGAKSAFGAGNLGAGDGIVNATASNPTVTAALQGTPSAPGVSVDSSIANAFDTQLANTSTMQSATALNSGGLGASGVGTGVAEGGGTAAADAAAAALAESTAATTAGTAAAGAAAETTLAATASAAIPFVGWAAAAGMLAYSLFG